MTTVTEIAQQGCPKCGDKDNLRVGGETEYTQDVRWTGDRLEYGAMDFWGEDTEVYIYCEACSTETPIREGGEA